MMCTAHIPYYIPESGFIWNEDILPVVNVEFHQHWAYLPEDCRDFIIATTHLDPNQRMSPEEALKHPWIKRTLRKSSSQIELQNTDIVE
jgi:serine/threonine protein kinase